MLKGAFPPGPETDSSRRDTLRQQESDTRIPN